MQAFNDFLIGLPSDIRKAVVGKLSLNVDDVNTALGTTYKDMAEFVELQKSAAADMFDDSNNDAQKDYESRMKNQQL